MDPDLVDYIIDHFSYLMNLDESKAWKHYAFNIKSYSSVEKRAIYYKKGWMTDDPNVLKLLNDGVEEFRKRTALRILKENEGKLKWNYCPKCFKLARTPDAKQCRYCGYDWHKENIDGH